MAAATLEDHARAIRCPLQRPSRGGLPARIGRYTVLSQLGLGGLALVLAVRCEDSGEIHAMKVLQSRSAGHLARFEVEALAMQSLAHPNVPHVYDFGYDAILGLHYLVMERAWSSAAEACHTSLLSCSRVASWMVQALCALQATHERGIVHRDVKPGNLLLDADERVLLTDFGIARMTGLGPTTAPEAVLGSPGFMAPEQLEDADEVGPEADLYAAGATLFFLSSRSSPCDLWRSCAEDPRWDVVPDLVRSVAFRATRLDPVDRYPNARTMARDLAPLVPPRAWARWPHLGRWLA